MPRSRPGPVTSVPSSVIEPSVGSIRPATSRNRLVLPEPKADNHGEFLVGDVERNALERRHLAPRLRPNRNATSSMHSLAMGVFLLCVILSENRYPPGSSPGQAFSGSRTSSSMFRRDWIESISLDAFSEPSS